MSLVPDRSFALIIGVPVLGIVFGAFVDMFHHVFQIDTLSEKLMSIVEDGGKMVSVSLVCTAAYAVLQLRTMDSGK